MNKILSICHTYITQQITSLWPSHARVRTHKHTHILVGTCDLSILFIGVPLWLHPQQIMHFLGLKKNIQDVILIEKKKKKKNFFHKHRHHESFYYGVLRRPRGEYDRFAGSIMFQNHVLPKLQVQTPPIFTKITSYGIINWTCSPLVLSILSTYIYSSQGL